MITRLLARWRVALGFVMAAVVLWLAAPTWASMAIGASVTLMGEALRALAPTPTHSRRVERAGNVCRGL